MSLGRFHISFRYINGERIYRVVSNDARDNRDDIYAKSSKDLFAKIRKAGINLTSEENRQIVLTIS